jgi:anti-sigma factor RsiW
VKDETHNRRAGLAATEHVSGLLAGYALGALEPDETEQVLRHLAGCSRCQAELQDYQVVAGQLASDAPVQAVPVRARAALLARVAQIGTTNPEQLVALAPPIPDDTTQPRWIQRIPKVAWFSVAPAAVLLVALAISSVLMGFRINEQESELASVEEDRGMALEVLAAETNARFISELTATDAAPGAKARLFVDLRANNAMLVAIHLPDPPEGGGYVAWLMVHDEYSLVGPLELDKIGRTQLIIDPPDDLNKYQTFIVTLEPDIDARSPAGPRVFDGAIHPRGDGDPLVAFTP